MKLHQIIYHTTADESDTIYSKWNLIITHSTTLSAARGGRGKKKIRGRETIVENVPDCRAGMRLRVGRQEKQAPLGAI